MAPRGRPAKKPTYHERERVMRLRADGWSVERIARVMETDHETLRKHFADELEHGADIKIDALLEYAERGAKKGSQASIKWLHERYSSARAASQLEVRSQAPAPEPKPPKLGKKELQQEAAGKVGGKFAVPAAPKLH